MTFYHPYTEECAAAKDLRRVVRLKGNLIRGRTIEDVEMQELTECMDRLSYLPAEVVIELVVKAQSGGLPLRAQ